MNETKFTVEPNTQSLSIERTFNAPVDKVFDAFVNPEKVVRWWGGKTFETKADTFEPRSGGSWRIVQSDENGEYNFHGVFHEVALNERIIWTFEFEGLPEKGHALMETMHFTEQDGKTTIKSVSVFQSVADRDGMVASGMEDGSRAGYDALAELVEG
ncbi:MAG TPA: SRPBCC family protein [Candidatus Saccharimonadales bacterium]|jgi:uncharacterized protein YndB with AHSA1/START domain